MNLKAIYIGLFSSFFLFFCWSLLTSSCFEQWNEPDKLMDSLPPPDLKLRVAMQLVDSSELACSDYPNSFIFSFRIEKLFSGRYPSDTIYVYAVKQSLYKFENHQNPKSIYWWVLIKTEDSIHQLPIYRHSGNF
jgi:hypothetical protein